MRRYEIEGERRDGHTVAQDIEEEAKMRQLQHVSLSPSQVLIIEPTLPPEDEEEKKRKEMDRLLREKEIEAALKAKEEEEKQKERIRKLEEKRREEEEKEGVFVSRQDMMLYSKLLGEEAYKESGDMQYLAKSIRERKEAERVTKEKEDEAQKKKNRKEMQQRLLEMFEEAKKNRVEGFPPSQEETLLVGKQPHEEEKGKPHVPMMHQHEAPASLLRPMSSTDFYQAQLSRMYPSYPMQYDGTATSKHARVREAMHIHAGSSSHMLSPSPSVGHGRSSYGMGLRARSFSASPLLGDRSESVVSDEMFHSVSNGFMMPTVESIGIPSKPLDAMNDEELLRMLELRESPAVDLSKADESLYKAALEELDLPELPDISSESAAMHDHSISDLGYNISSFVSSSYLSSTLFHSVPMVSFIPSIETSLCPEKDGYSYASHVCSVMNLHKTIPHRKDKISCYHDIISGKEMQIQHVLKRDGSSSQDIRTHSSLIQYTSPPQHMLVKMPLDDERSLRQSVYDLIEHTGGGVEVMFEQGSLCCSFEEYDQEAWRIGMEDIEEEMKEEVKQKRGRRQSKEGKHCQIV
ncbi:hypothetical protein ADUPG1_006095 [Aduncisulcus paluster]|uniref:Uncharacterized protein n=1 Tax=Aduncisulcus paluster TaxID=2918883 RepID=A0ABQ5KGS2_9EUKA|nr:hypothetical protein ADUPG1_006095 [Aduncisulcus paluster]